MLDQTVLHNVLDGIEPRIRVHLEKRTSSSSPQKPFILGVTGLQGSGKSTWSSAIVKALNERGFTTQTLSLDDLYHDHDHLVELKTANPDNQLFRTRGQPGTHDEELARWFFGQFEGGRQEEVNKEILFPAFDKSKFNGEGDRVPKNQWNKYDASKKPLEVLVFEGWCVGFRPIDDEEVDFKRSTTRESSTSDSKEEISTHTLPNHPLEHLLLVNSKLKGYCESFMGPQHIDYLVHLDTDELSNVYIWRLEQEEKLRLEKGTGMPEPAVVAFVRGYMPAYELYLEGLREGFYSGMLPCCKGKSQMRIVMDEQREVIETQELNFIDDERGDDDL